MNAGIVKSKASGIALMGKVLVAGMAFAVVPHNTSASSLNAQFEQYIINLCANPPVTPPANWDVTAFNTMCAIQGGSSSGGASVSVNLGIANAGGGLAARKRKGVPANQDQQPDESEKGASADEGGWGFLLTPQYGKSNRAETDLENGYQSDLRGLVVGVDYRFSDNLVLGATIGQTTDRANFLNNAGSSKTRNDSFSLYGTWLPRVNIAIDGYLGYGKIKLDNHRRIDWATTPGSGFFGVVSGNTTGRQVLAGLSANSQIDFAQFNLDPFIDIDYVKTSFKGYNETGNTTIEMHYGDRDAISLISNLGVRLGSSYGYDWGALLPSIRLAAAHEFQNKTQQINNELVSTPGATGFSVATDSPDRNYLNIGLSLVAALDGGGQFFLDYEKRTQDKLLSSWAVSLGGLFEF